MRSTALGAILASVVTCPCHAQAPPVAWVQQIGTTAWDQSNGVAVDASGNAFISGYTEGSLGGPNAGGGDAFLARYDGAGNLLWTRQIGTSEGDTAWGVAVDASGNAFISGRTNGSLGEPNAGLSDAFLARFDASGNQIWIRQFGTSSNDDAYGVAVDAFGNAWVAGTTTGSLGGPNTGFVDDAFLVRYDASGNQIWIRQFGTSSFDEARGVAVDAFGNAYVAGWTADSLGGPSAGGFDVFLAKYDTSGNPLWIRQFGSSSNDYAYGVAVDAAGNAYVTGWTTGSLGGPHAGASDAFLARYDASGNLIWTRQLGTVFSDAAFGVAVDASGNAYFTGYTWGSLGGPNAGDADVFLAMYDASGALRWIRQFGASDWEGTSGVAVDASCNAYLTGLTTGSLGGPHAGDLDAFLAKFRSDTDGDGLCDDWEINGIPYVDSNGVQQRYVLPGADPMHKNLYVEMDAMSGLAPAAGVIAEIEAAFTSAPASLVNNPNGKPGVLLRIEVDETDIPKQPWDNGWADFDAVKDGTTGNPKDGRFGTFAERNDPEAEHILEAKRMAYRYCIVADEFHDPVSGKKPLGIAELPGNDFVIALGRATPPGGTAQLQAGVIMHELGHTLGLRHGGADNKNFKPNYFSVMNYLWTDQTDWNAAFRELDYSRSQMSTLHEMMLVEGQGLGGDPAIYVGRFAPYALPSGVGPVLGGDPCSPTCKAYASMWSPESVDWNGNGQIDAVPVQADINFFRMDDPTAAPGQELTGHEDWSKLVYDFRDSPYYEKGAHLSSAEYGGEITLEVLEALHQIPPPPTCYADCDKSGALDLFDFLCFVNAFNAGNPYADCDGSGGLDLFDFLCFVNAFNAGCP